MKFLKLFSWKKKKKPSIVKCDICKKEFIFDEVKEGDLYIGVEDLIVFCKGCKQEYLARIRKKRKGKRGK